MERHRERPFENPLGFYWFPPPNSLISRLEVLTRIDFKVESGDTFYPVSNELRVELRVCVLSIIRSTHESIYALKTRKEMIKIKRNTSFISLFGQRPSSSTVLVRVGLNEIKDWNHLWSCQQFFPKKKNLNPMWVNIKLTSSSCFYVWLN